LNTEEYQKEITSGYFYGTSYIPNSFQDQLWYINCVALSAFHQGMWLWWEETINDGAQSMKMFNSYNKN